MTTHADPKVKGPHSQLQVDQAALEVLHKAERAHDETTQVLRELKEMIVISADLRTHVLTAARPTDTVMGVGVSIGVLNPTPGTVYLGVAGGAPIPNGRGVPVPANSLLVLPIQVANVEIGMAAGDLAQDRVVFVMLYERVQPAFLGRPGSA